MYRFAKQPPEWLFELLALLECQPLAGWASTRCTARGYFNRGRGRAPDPRIDDNAQRQHQRLHAGT